MSYWSSYDKQSYKDSKKRRRQALKAGQTGKIEPIRKGKGKTLAVCLATLIVIGLASVSVYFLFFNANDRPADEKQADLPQSIDLTEVINKQNPLPSSYIPDLISFNGVSVNTALYDSLKQMCDDAKEQGAELKINSAYVSYGEQEELYNQTLNNLLSNPDYTHVRAEAAAQRLVPQAGCSEAQTGLLLDFDLSDEHTRAYLERNCVKFGFILRYPGDKEELTHLAYSKTLYRYVGSENAVKMRSYNMCLEEYSEYISYNQSIN